MKTVRNKKNTHLVLRRTGKLQKFNPGKTALKIHESESLMAAAKRARDPEKFEEAIEDNLGAKRDFATGYKVRFPHRGPKIVASTGHNLSPAEFCRSYGLADRTVRRWVEKLLDQDSFDAELKAGLAKVASLFLDIAKGDTTASKWTGDPESYTPAKYIESARIVMGEIDLDPASVVFAQRIVKARKFFDEEKNGLLQDWSGRIFLNPPYKYPLVEEFIDKLLIEYAAKKVTAAILLTNNNTDTKWWHSAAQVAAAVCFTAGRINFYKADGSESQPTNGQNFFYFGEQAATFANEFTKHGLTMIKHGN